MTIKIPFSAIKLTTLSLIFLYLFYLNANMIQDIADRTVGHFTAPALRSTKEISYDAYKKIKSNDLQLAESEYESSWDLTNPYYFYESSPIVAIVFIDSIEGGRNIDPTSGQNIFTQTYGKMTVSKVLKGELAATNRINFARLGGIVTYDEYWNGLSEPQRDKILVQNNGTKPELKKYIKERFAGDIDIEVSRRYLAFLTPQLVGSEKRLEYMMDGAQYGLRQVKGIGKTAMVLNNQTKKWDKLSDIVKLK